MGLYAYDVERWASATLRLDERFCYVGPEKLRALEASGCFYALVDGAQTANINVRSVATRLSLNKRCTVRCALRQRRPVHALRSSRPRSQPSG